MNKLIAPLAPLAALAASAAMLWFGTGLHPLWALTWLAPLPVLWAAARLPLLPALGLAAAAWLIGACNEWSFVHGRIGMPLTMVLGFVVQPTLVFCLAVGAWRYALQRGAPLRAALAYAGVLAGAGFATQRLSPHSTWGSLAYSQMDCLPVLQAAALGGVAAVTFLVGFAPAALAAAALGPAAPRRRLFLAGGTLALLAAVTAWGAWRLQQPAGPEVKVGLIASDLERNLFVKDAAGRQALFAGYSAKAAELIGQGAQLVVIPEKIARMYDDTIAEIDAPFSLAAAQGAVIVVGVERWSGADKLNEARIYGPQGLWDTYEKRHMIPLFESELKVGTSRTLLPHASGLWGVQICKDLDFPELSREYGNDGIGLLLVPAWDFIDDGWLHDRMAVMRGVESGFSIARAPKQGLLTLSDSRGRVLAQAPTDGAEFTSLLGSVPVRHEPTLYAAWGDWFSWLVLGLLILSLLSILGRQR